MNPLCPVCGHPVRVVGDDREGTMHYEPDEAEARREGWDAALRHASTQHGASISRCNDEDCPLHIEQQLTTIRPHLASEGPR